MTGSRSYWNQVRTGGGIPSDRPLADLTVELTRMLGDADPEVREATGVATLLAWLRLGVYDDLLTGLGDGMAAGLSVRPGEPAHRRVASARVLTACLQRAESHHLVPDAIALRWADQLVTWFVTEPDHSGLDAGAAALAQIARSAHLGGPEQLVLLDVLADRVLAAERIALADLDALIGVVVVILRRAEVTADEVEAWVLRLGRAAVEAVGRERPAEALLRVLYTHLALSRADRASMPQRADLILLLVDVLREINPDLSGH